MFIGGVLTNGSTLKSRAFSVYFKFVMNISCFDQQNTDTHTLTLLDFRCHGDTDIDGYHT